MPLRVSAIASFLRLTASAPLFVFCSPIAFCSLKCSPFQKNAAAGGEKRESGGILGNRPPEGESWGIDRADKILIAGTGVL
jgi:hypothetical protein